MPLISNLKSRRYFSPFSGERRQEQGGRWRAWSAIHAREINACRVLVVLVARSGNLGSNKKCQDGGRQAWWFVFYRVSSISKVCSHCLFEVQSLIVLFSTYHLIFWKLTYFFHGLSTLFMLHHILYFSRIRIICQCLFFNFSLVQNVFSSYFAEFL